MRATADRATVRLRRVTALAAVVMTVVVVLVARAAGDADAVVPGADPWFAASSVWETAVAPDAPLDPNSPAIVAHLKATAARATIATTQYGVPIYRVGPDQPLVRVGLTVNNAPLLQAAINAVPMPADADGAAGTDGAAVVYQASTDTVWEFFRLRNTPTGFKADWAGRIIGVSTDPGYFRDLLDASGKVSERAIWGITGAKLARLAGLITISDMRSGVIDHALAIAVAKPRAGAFAWPAQGSDGTDPAADAVPEGAHFRLDPALNVETLKVGPVTKMLARAAQTYGLIVDNGAAGAVVFPAEDPQTLPNNPYPALFGGLNGSQIAKAFPWNRLQLLAMDLRTQSHP